MNLPKRLKRLKEITRKVRNLALNKSRSEEQVRKIFIDFYRRKHHFIGIQDGKYAYCFPKLIQIDLTNMCNNSCIGCWCNSPLLGEMRMHPKERRKVIDYERIIQLINEVKCCGTTDIYLGGGGEPFMHPRALDIIEYIKKNNLVCHINTNFTLVNEKTIKKMVDWKVDHITVSLWAGDAETYVKTHPNQTKKTFEKIERALSLLKTLKEQKNQEKPLIKIYNVISKINYKNIRMMYEFSREIADSVEFTVIDVVEGKTDFLLLSNEERRKLLKEVSKIKEEYEARRKEGDKFIIFRFEQFIRRISSPYATKGLYDKKEVDKIPCYVGWVFSRIMADGSVIPCLKAHKLPLGNINKQNFKKIWFSEDYNKFRYMAKHYKKGNPFFSKINCYKGCDDLGRNREVHSEIKGMSKLEKEMLSYATKLKKIEGTITYLKAKKVDIEDCEKEFKVLDKNLESVNIKILKKRINRLLNKLEQKVRENNKEQNGKNSDVEVQQPLREYINRSFKGTDVLLVMCPPWDFKKPPLNIAYLVTYLKDKKIKADAYDLNILLYHLSTGEQKIYWNMQYLMNNLTNKYATNIMKKNKRILEKFVDKLVKDGVKIVGFSVNPANYRFTFLLSQMIKRKNSRIKIILGGPFIFQEEAWGLIPKKSYDYLIVGEGERPLHLLVNALLKGESADKIKGVIPREKVNERKTTYDEVLDINKIPYPKFEEFNLSLYTTNELPVLLSRGCIGRCSYCVDYLMSKRFRFKKPELMVEELEFLSRKYKTKYFAFNDLLINGNLKQLEKICDLIIEKRLKIFWHGYAMIRRDMSDELLKKMKEAGCVSLHYGFESGSNKVLKLMNKYYTAEDAEDLIRRTKKAGIGVVINIIVGFPGESEKEFQETINFIRRNHEFIDEVGNVSALFVMGKTDLQKNPKKYGYVLTKDYEAWYDKHNNVKIRTRKVFIVSKIFDYYGIPVGIKNIYRWRKLNNKIEKSISNKVIQYYLNQNGEDENAGRQEDIKKV